MKVLMIKVKYQGPRVPMCSDPKLLLALLSVSPWRFGDYANSSNCLLLPWAYFPSVLGPWASNHSHTSTFIGPNRTMGPTIELDLFTWSTWTMWVKMAHGFGLCWLGYDSFEGKTYQPFQLSSRKTLQPLTFCLRKPLTFLVDRESTFIQSTHLDH